MNGRGRAEPLYDRGALRRVRVIRTLAEELDVNLPGIDVILHLLDQMARADVCELMRVPSRNRSRSVMPRDTGKMSPWRG